MQAVLSNNRAPAVRGKAGVTVCSKDASENCRFSPQAHRDRG
jgi:hypothetical protein